MIVRLAAAILALAVLAGEPVADDPTAAARRALIEEVMAGIRATARVTGTPGLDPRLVEAMSTVPRHLFVPEPLQGYAYINRPLPVGRGQTESQPYIVALMTELARIEKGANVLLIGIGGGWHAAILAELGANLRVVELDDGIERAARERLKAQGYGNIEIRVGDPYFGWGGARAAFDAIIVRHAFGELPAVLVGQLKPGGRLVMPLGHGGDGQMLTLVEKTAAGEVTQRGVLPVRFNLLPGGQRI